MTATRELLDELATVAAQVRAFLEWHAACGATGIVRRTRTATSVEAPGAPSPAETRAATTAPAQSAPPTPVRAVDADAPARVPAVAVIPPKPVTKPLPVLAEEAASCNKCALHTSRKTSVFARGNPQATVCFVGGAPSAEDEAAGRPFSGAQGELLDRMITAMGLHPENDVYICNALKCRPPDDRRPEAQEIACCTQFLRAQLGQLQPRAIVALGGAAARALTGIEGPIERLRGNWRLYDARTPLMPTFHPGHLLQRGPPQSEAKRQAWDDLQAVMKSLGLSRRPAR